MAVTVRTFACEISTENFRPTQSSYTFENIPRSGVLRGLVVTDYEVKMIIEGDFNLDLLNPGSDRTFRPVAPNAEPPTALGTLYAGVTFIENNNVRFWYQDPLPLL